MVNSLVIPRTKPCEVIWRVIYKNTRTMTLSYVYRKVEQAGTAIAYTETVKSATLLISVKRKKEQISTCTINRKESLHNQESENMILSEYIFRLRSRHLKLLPNRKNRMFTSIHRMCQSFEDKNSPYISAYIYSLYFLERLLHLHFAEVGNILQWPLLTAVSRLTLIGMVVGRIFFRGDH